MCIRDSYNVLSLGPIVVPRLPALKKFSWEGLLPGRPNDPWVLTKNEFREPEFYIQFFEAAMNDRVPVVYTPCLLYTSGVLQMAAIKDISEAPTAEDFNNLLAALRTAGMLAES